MEQLSSFTTTTEPMLSILGIQLVSPRAAAAETRVP